MKLGFPTNPRKNIFDEIDWIQRNNFDFVDLFLEPDQNDISNIDPKKLLNHLKNANLNTVGHTAWYLPIGSPIKELRNVAVDLIKKHIIFFDSINCNKMTVHANWPSGMFSDIEGINFQRESFQEILNFSENYGVKIMIEPINTERDSIENIEKILNLNKNLFFHLDVGHANLFNRNPVEFIRKFKKKLLHIHLHDNNGIFDLHNPLGTGNIQWKEILKELKSFYNETITLEIFSSNKDYAIMSKDLVLKELKSMELKLY